MHKFTQAKKKDSPQAAAAHLSKTSNDGNSCAQLQDNRPKSVLQRKVNNTGLPDNLKSGIENLSGHSMDDVKVHYNSSKPAQLNAHAYAQGNQIHLASGQERHLPHEAWHVVQQKQGRVRPTMQMKGKVNINDDKGLEKEADEMGAKALNFNASSTKSGILQKGTINNNFPAQLMKIKIFKNEFDTDNDHEQAAIFQSFKDMYRAGFIDSLQGILRKLDRSESEKDEPYIERLHEMLQYGGLNSFVKDVTEAQRQHRKSSGEGTNTAKSQLRINGNVIHETPVIKPGKGGDYSYKKGGHPDDVDNSRADSEVLICDTMVAKTKAFVAQHPNPQSITVNVVSWWGPCDACKHRFDALKKELAQIAQIKPSQVKVQVFYLHKATVFRGQGKSEKRTHYGDDKDKEVGETGLHGHLH